MALLLLVPHLVWQYEHDWASFAYHLSGRNSVFRPGYVVEFLANVLVVFNPFFVPLYVQAWRKDWSACCSPMRGGIPARAVT